MNESNLDYKKRVLDAISPTYCAGKALGGTIWLGSGSSAQCHHPPASKIPLTELKASYKALLNTEYRKTVRKEMIDGIQTKECDYCWRVENLGKDLVSDRVYKSIIHSEDDIQKSIEQYKNFEDIAPKTLEISFDNLCNFACSYCNASFSSTWAHDIKVNGAYQNLVSDGAGAYHQDGSWAMPYGIKNKDNPYTEAFWQWWNNELQYSLVELRITGGEGTMSPDFWKLIDWWEQNPNCKVRLAVNSNLGAKKELIERLCRATHSFEDFHLYTSNESFGAHAEYIRDGLVWDEWLNNFEYILSEGNCKNTHVMMTINALCLFSITEFMDEMLKLKEKHGHWHAGMSFNILRFPSFMSVNTLPYIVREAQAVKIQTWAIANRSKLQNHEYEGIERMIAYIREVDEGHSNVSSLESRQRDFRTFFAEYDQRRGKNFVETFPALKDWYLSLPETKLKPIKELINGDNTKAMEFVHKELLNKAKEEGWILSPSKANPGSQEYVEPQTVRDIINPDTNE
jgi:hypothetical protein